MTEQEILDLLDDERKRLQVDDTAHLRLLNRQVGGRRRFRHWWGIAGTVALLLLVGIPIAVGIQSKTPQIACNRSGDTEAVILCAQSLLP